LLTDYIWVSYTRKVSILHAGHSITWQLNPPP